MITIDRFDGNWKALSNFYPCSIYYKDQQWFSVEHAYQAAKTDNADYKYYIQRASTAKVAKKRGHEIPKEFFKANWDEIKVEIMRELVRLKFTTDNNLAIKLLETGDAVLVEGNWWGDTFWGMCDGKGKNHLGKILMDVRNELQSGGEQGTRGNLGNSTDRVVGEPIFSNTIENRRLDSIQLENAAQQIQESYYSIFPGSNNSWYGLIR